MNFFQFLKSLDDLLFEVVSWLVFYPVTMWRAIRHPIAIMEYAAAELKQPAENQFEDALSPPILLLLTILVAHGIELSLIGESEIITKTNGFAGLISDETSLILLRLIAFATFPLIFAVRTVRKQNKPLTRRALEPHFFSQCYANAPFALLISIAATTWQMPYPGMRWASFGLFALSAAAFVVVETAWFRKALGVGAAGALWNTLIAYAEAIAFMIAVGWLVGGATW
jgi:hypothetical protein